MVGDGRIVINIWIGGGGRRRTETGGKSFKGFKGGEFVTCWVCVLE